MNKDELRELLHQEYKTENWKKIAEFVFPNVQYLQRPQSIPFSTEKVESFKQIGNVKLNDGKNLAMFEVKVVENINIPINRVELRNLVENLIDQERNHGVLVIYEQGKEDYRFTFTAKSTEFDDESGDFINKETDAKRFTYVLGKNESCKTATNRFWELSSQKENATIKDVEAAFSVEKLNKEFFSKYKEFYENFVEYITGKRFVKEKGKWVEKETGSARPEHEEVFGSDDKQARNFVKLLLGRLVFIQFLQKKGWMGVPSTNVKWKGGDTDFLNNLFIKASNKGEFHSKYLYSLFYNAFNTPNRPNDIFALTQNRVPYLNGGLFENENSKTNKIDFPETYFGSLLDFFSQYNFTIDENDPLDHEVGIDPEMLGHIFENLLEDNKDKGAFYTPKPIVQYMCQESLIQYLKTYLQEHNVWPNNLEEAKNTHDNLQKFVRNKIAGEILNDYDEHLARAFKEVKICDPAIGSGAFPMGILNEIFHCMQVLHNASPDSVGAVWEMEDWSPDIVKKNIIQHSIYGVDLEKGAVDIARLRFWLSLIVDEKEPTPLPNLDFKIMQGDSLLESYEGIDLSKISNSKTVVTEIALDLFGNPVNAQSSIFDTKYIDESNISELIDSYFNTQIPVKKQSLKKEIDDIIHKHIDYNFEFEENKILITIANIKKKLGLLKIDNNHSKAVRDKTLKSIIKLTNELEENQVEINLIYKKRKDLHNLQKTSDKPYFLWHLYFKDIVEKGGFDIIIGNPPYGTSIKGEYRKLIEKDLGKVPDYEIYYYFNELANKKIKKNAVLSYIIPNTFLFNVFASEYRKELLDKWNIINIVDCTKFKIFEDATVHNCINIFQKPSDDINDFIGYKPTRFSENFRHLISQKTLHIAKSILLENNQNWGLVFKLEKTIIALIQKIKNHNKLSEYYDVTQGYIPYRKSDLIKTHGAEKAEKIVNNREWHSNIKISSEYKEEIWGESLSKYSYSTTGSYVWYGKHLATYVDLKFFNQKRLLVREITNPSIIACIVNEELVNDPQIINIIEKNISNSISIEFLWGILNSKLATFYHFNSSPKASKGSFPKILIYDINNFPLNVPKEMNLFNKIIVEMNECKKRNLDISGLENKLDYMIYKLYKLTFEEVRLIDPLFSLTKSEYSKIIIE